MELFVTTTAGEPETSYLNNSSGMTLGWLLEKAAAVIAVPIAAPLFSNSAMCCCRRRTPARAPSLGPLRSLRPDAAALPLRLPASSNSLCASINASMIAVFVLNNIRAASNATRRFLQIGSTLKGAGHASSACFEFV